MKENIASNRGKIKQLLEKQNLAVLATQGDNYPYNTLVAYAFSEDLHIIIFATMKHTRKYNNLAKHASVSLLIDSRTNKTEDFKEAVALTVLGKTKPSNQPQYRHMFLHRFPHLKDFLDDPQTTIIVVEIDKYIYVQRFQEVLELKMQ